MLNSAYVAYYFGEVGLVLASVIINFYARP